MSFWLHESYIISTLRSWSLLRRAIISIALILALISCSYFVMQSSNHAPRELLKLERLQYQLSQVGCVLDEHTMLVERCAVLQNDFSARGLGELCFEEIHEQLLLLIKECGLICVSFEQQQSDGVIALMLVGSYHRMITFIRKLNNSMPTVKIMRLLVEPSQQELLQISLSCKKVAL